MNEYDHDSVVQPYDVPLRTVGLYIALPHVLPAGGLREQLEDVEAMVELMQSLSRAKGLPLVLEYEGERIGAIRMGVLDDGVRRGLLEPWRQRVSDLDSSR